MDGEKQLRGFTHFLAGYFDGKFVLPTGAMSEAIGGERAQRTGGIAWGTKSGAEFHHSLIEVAGVTGVEEGLRHVAQSQAGGAGAGRSCFGGEAAENANHVSIEDRVGKAEGNAGDGGGGIGTDAGEGADGIVIGGKAAAFDDGFRGAMHIARARVIAQAGPMSEHVGLGGGGEFAGGREAQQEAAIVRNDGRGARLLQHHFG